MTIFDGKLLFAEGKNHLDIYLNFDCNLRCNHCFLGDELNRRQNFEIDSVISLMRYARENGCEEISFLGGEPTLYRELDSLVGLGFELGYKEIKVITNGLKTAQSFLSNFKSARKPTIVFSCDGSTQATFEKIRGKNSFKVFKDTVALATKSGFPCAGIISVSNDNIGEVCDIVAELDSIGFNYVNVHHVNHLGFAQSESVISVENWLALRKSLVWLSATLQVKIKFERKFMDRESEDLATDCVINKQQDGNVMVFPDGRVYRCALFFDAGGLNSLTWSGQHMLTRTGLNEQLICGFTDECEGCAGSVFLKKEVARPQGAGRFKTICMYKKEIL